MGTEEPKRSDKDKRRKIPLVQIFGKEKMKGKIELERTTLEPSPAGTGVEAPGQPRLSCREMQRTTIDGCTYAGGISLQVIVRVKSDNQTSHCAAHFSGRTRVWMLVFHLAVFRFFCQ